jgi:hypothetical protein
MPATSPAIPPGCKATKEVAEQIAKPARISQIITTRSQRFGESTQRGSRAGGKAINEVEAQVAKPSRRL